MSDDEVGVGRRRHRANGGVAVHGRYRLPAAFEEHNVRGPGIGQSHSRGERVVRRRAGHAAAAAPRANGDDAGGNASSKWSLAAWRPESASASKALGERSKAEGSTTSGSAGPPRPMATTTGGRPFPTRTRAS